MATVRLSDIAKTANVSVSAVSKALADSPEIGAETKERICALAKSMGYHSNTLARSLRLGRSTLIGVIVPNSDNPYYSSILQGIAECARKRDYTIIIAISNEKNTDEIAAIRSLLSIPVAGILAVPVNISNYQEVQIPLVFLSRFPYRQLSVPMDCYPHRNSYSFVVNDDFEGQRIATCNLTARGITDLYLLLDTNDRSNVSSFKTFARLDGYKHALAESQIAYREDHVFFNVNTIEACYETVDRICCQRASASIGICVTNDYLAIGAFNAIRKHHLSIPEQVALVGYDDVEIAQYFSPPLTTVHVANKDLGRYGTTHLFDLIHGVVDVKQNISTVLSPYLEVRQSS